MSESSQPSTHPAPTSAPTPGPTPTASAPAASAPTPHALNSFDAVSSGKLIFLNPVFHKKIWGARHLADDFGYDIPDGKVGECWAISAHPNGDCTVAAGPFQGTTLSQLWDAQPALFGHVAYERFPLLVKILDANDDLSIQVHPDDDYARVHEHGSFGKSECWYVLAARPGATIIVGQKAHSREEFKSLVDQGKWDELLNEIPVHAGDFFQIDPGCVHAVKAGTIVLEPQQSSDITYRVYDYDRRQKDGSLRELHMRQSLDTINYHAPLLTDGKVMALEEGGLTLLCACKRYVVRRLRVAGSKHLRPRAPFSCVSIVEGEGSVCGVPVHKGSHMIASARATSLDFEGEMTAILTSLPEEAE